MYLIMTIEAVVIVGIVIAHLLGVLLFMLNACYLKVTRGYDKSRNVNTGNEELDKLKSKRCCKLRSFKAMNFLVMYHVMLVILDFIIAFIHLSQDPEDRVLSITPTVIWILPGIAYMVLFIFMPIAMMCGLGTLAHTGPLHAFNIFDFLHLVIFWASLICMLTCAGADCSGLHSDLQNLASGYAAIPFAWSYLLMIWGACMNKGFFKLGKKVISKQDALNFINEKLQETPSIEWTVSCGHSVTTGKRSKFLSKLIEFIETRGDHGGS